MSNTPGATLVISTIEAASTPTTPATFAATRDTGHEGGAHAVADTAARDAIPLFLLKPGTIASYPDGTFDARNAANDGWVAGASGDAEIGTVWTQNTLPTIGGAARTFARMAYGNGRFVASRRSNPSPAASDVAWWSDDGVTWTPGVGPAIENGVWGFVAFGAGLFVAVSFIGTIVTSTDGVTWAERAGPPSSNPLVECLIYGPAGFVAALRYTFDPSASRIWMSADGITWTAPATTGNLLRKWYCGAYGAGLYAIGSREGSILTSPDGVNWTERVPDSVGAGFPNYHYDAVFADGLFVFVGAYGIMVSPDGISWSTSYASVSGETFFAVSYGAGRFIAYGSLRTLISYDGLSWSGLLAAPFNLQAAAYGEGRFVTLRSGISYVSTSTQAQLDDHAALVVGAHGETAAGAALTTAASNTAQRTVLGLGGAATLNVGTVAGTVAAGDDARIAAAARLSAVSVLGTDSPAIDFAGAATQTRAATGAVTITATGYAAGLSVAIDVTNTTLAAIAITVVPAWRWAGGSSKAPTTLAVGATMRISAASDGAAAAAVLAAFAVFS